MKFDPYRMAVLTMEELIARAVNGDLEGADVEAFCVAEGVDRDEFYNRISRVIAGRFYGNAMSYEDGDQAMNSIWPLMLRDCLASGTELPQPAYAIYEAFDAAEWLQGDPIEEVTRPEIRKLLSEP